MKNGIQVPKHLYRSGWEHVSELWSTNGSVIIYNESATRISYNWHRIDGPAVIYNDGKIYWVVNGELIYKWERFKILSKIDDEALSLLILKYGDI